MLLWCSCKVMTVRVRVVDGIIVKKDTAPVLKKFIGQRFSNLREWMKKQGDYKRTRMKEYNK